MSPFPIKFSITGIEGGIFTFDAGGDIIPKIDNPNPIA